MRAGEAVGLADDVLNALALVTSELVTTRAQPRADVFRFVEVGYNRTRLRKHPEPGCLTPLETGARLRHDCIPAA